MRLSASLIKLLVLFASRRGELITREAIAECLWQEPQQIDVSNRINTAVNRLRAALEDDSAAPKYLETVVGLGYRFIADVQERAEPAFTSDQNMSPGRIRPDRPQAVMIAGLGPSTLLSEVLDTPLQAVLEPMTPASTEAREALRRPERGRRSTTSWRHFVIVSCIAFLLVSTGTAVWITARKTRSTLPPVNTSRNSMALFQTTFNDGDNRVFTAAVSHSGGSMAYGDSLGVSVRVIETGMDQLLSSPQGLLCNRIVWYPGDSELLVSYADAEGDREQVWTLPLNGGLPHLLLADAAWAVISPDGSRLVFTRNHGSELWTSSIKGDSARKLATAAERDSFSSLLWSWDGKRIIYNHRQIPGADPARGEAEERGYSMDYESLDVSTGAVLATRKNVPFRSAVLLRDGRFLFPQSNLEFDNPDARLMVAKTSPSTGEFLEAPHRISDIPADAATAFSASDSAERIGVVLERRSASVAIGEVHFPGPTLTAVRRLKHPAPDNYPHTWTPTGDAVVFESDSTGSYSVFKQKLDGTAAELLARSQGDAVLPQVSPDGKWILFENYAGQPSYHADAIFRVPLLGGKIEQVATRGPIDTFKCSGAPSGRCVLRQKIGKELVYFELDPVSGQGQELGRAAWQENFLGDWSLSPDGTTVASPIINPLRTGIRIARLLQGAPLPSFDIPVKTIGSLIQVAWAPDSRGFYAEAKSNEGYALLYIDRLGRPTTLRRSGAVIWAVPSRDGKRLAFTSQNSNSNVWVGPGSNL